MSKSLNYIFNVEIAKNYGISEAIFINNLIFWISKNKANNKNIHREKAWSYNSQKSYCELFPFWSESQVKRIIKSLKDKKIIEVDCFSDNRYDRTNYYTFTDVYYSEYIDIEYKNNLFHGTKTANHIDENQQSTLAKIDQSINTDIKTDIKTNVIYISILKYWNTKEIIKHKDEGFLIKIKTSNGSIKKVYKDIFKIYSEEEICNAINNYDHVLKSDAFYWSHKWPLCDFLTRGLEKFLDCADPLNNFKNNNRKEKKAYEEDYFSNNDLNNL